MNILVLLQNIQGVGGTNLLLNKYSHWMLEVKNSMVYESINGFVDKKYRHINWDLVVLPTSEISTLIKLKINFVKFNKILVWSLGHNAFTEAFISGQINNKKIFFYKIINFYKNIFLKRLLEKNSIIFSDEVSLNSEITLDSFNFENLIFPILINEENRLIPNNDYYKDKTLRCTWIGRIDKDFKLIPILKLIGELKPLSKIYDIELNIIGSGDSVEIVLETVKSKNIKCNYIKHIPYEKLHNEIANITDLAFAMGTSSLDTSKVGIPTIIVQPLRESQNTYNLFTYRWIFESKGLSLGEFANKKTLPIQTNKSLKNIMNDYINENNLSDKSFNYSQNFYIDNVLNRLFEREMPKKIDFILWIYIIISYSFKESKNLIKLIKKKI